MMWTHTVDSRGLIPTEPLVMYSAVPEENKDFKIWTISIFIDLKNKNHVTNINLRVSFLTKQLFIGGNYY